MNRFAAGLPLRAREPSLYSRISIRRGCLVACVVGFSAVTSPVSAFLEIARGELILNTTADATFDSNIFAQNNEEEDLYFSLIPELRYLRQAGRGTIDARAGVDVTRFMDHGEEDYEDFFASLDIGYPVSEQSPLSGGFLASYTENSDVNEFLNTRVRSETFATTLHSLYRVSDRLALRNNLDYHETQTDAFSDVESYSGTIGMQWAYSSKLAWFSDYRLRRSTSTGDAPLGGQEDVDNLDHALFVGATGTLAPRVEGSASVGYQHTDARGDGENRGSLVTEAELEWAWKTRTDVTLTASRDLDISPTDETVETSGLAIGMEHRLDSKISLAGHIGYRKLDFRGGDREDDAIELGAGIHYILTRYWEAGFTYDYINNSSSMNEADYTRHLARIFTRYSF